jgi:hypothetical protein
LGIAISEAVELAVQRDDTKYALGSVLNHVLLHQTVTGLESIEQMQMADDYPDMIIGCTGGGSNFAGLAFPFLHQKMRDGLNTEFIAVEPSACPTLTKGAFAYDFGDTAHLTPLVKMYTLGSGFIPPGFHAGGLRYHGMAPQISHLAKLGLIAPRSYNQLECFDAGIRFAKAEGILPAPEANHAVRAAIHEAEKCRERGESKAILFNLCGHGHFDMQAYMDYQAGKLKDLVYDDAEVAMALAGLPSGLLRAHRSTDHTHQGGPSADRAAARAIAQLGWSATRERLCPRPRRRGLGLQSKQILVRQDQPLGLLLLTSTDQFLLPRAHAVAQRGTARGGDGQQTQRDELRQHHGHADTH